MTFFFFFNDTATTEIYTLSLHDALPILDARRTFGRDRVGVAARPGTVVETRVGQAQRVTARGIGVGIVGAEPRHAGGVEAWSSDHPSPAVDDQPGPVAAADVVDQDPAFFIERPTTDHIGIV